MITGAHSILYSKRPEADRAFLRDVIQLPNVDVGEGWLIFGLPPAEVAVHPSGKNDVHEFYLMCDDVQDFVRSMKDRHVACGPVQDFGWGVMTHVTLPGGGKLGVYQARHARPKSIGVGKGAGKARKTTAPKKTAPKKTRKAAKTTAARTAKKKARKR